MDAFENSLQHLLAELERIDLLLAAHVSRARQLYAHDEQFRGLYIPEEEVDALLAQPLGRPRWALERSAGSDGAATLAQLSQHIALRKDASLRRGISLRLHHLQQLFGLNQFEIDTMLICLGVEVDLRYERLYAYLHDDVTKKRPSVDLVLNLLVSSAEAKFEARRHFAASAPLLRHRVLELTEDPSQPHPPLLGKYLKIDERMAQYVLGSDSVDERLQPYVTLQEPEAHGAALLVDAEVTHRLSQFLQHGPRDNGMLVYLRGPYGVGKHSTAEVVCAEQSLRLLVVDLERLTSDADASYAKALSLIQREAKLQQAAVYWHGFDALLHVDKKGLLRVFQEALKDRPELSFLAGEQRWEPAGTLRGLPFTDVELRRSSFAERLRIWSASLNGRCCVDPSLDISALASKFKFTGGQIKDAAATAENLARFRDAEASAVTMPDLYEACRLHSNQKLASLARKVTPKYAWDDIVLPADRVAQLREICNHVKYREQVYGQWGFDRKLSLGKGLSILFSGPSGTGKTMAADIIAGELALDLYKIDLSMVISKYIGETEKNLSQIFAEADTSNAILFFDEADALFGKRSEVKDSHDRYANIEIGYLLQRMEEYEGVVILATNLRKNMDEAFVRRLHFTVEFPFPNAEDRCRIWQGVWPQDAPRHPSVDLEFLARRFHLAGGNIRNIALAAAFLAADDGDIIEMQHVMSATQREYQKMGKVISDADFELQSKNLTSAGRR
jgi:SpoVK/Ycf46/Vps4 family AAA+-type ATPase